MDLSCADGIDGLIRKLSGLQHLQDPSMMALEQLPMRIQTVKAGTTIVEEGQIISECCLLIEGYGCRYKLANHGGRQIVSFHVAGDILDIQHLLFD